MRGIRHVARVGPSSESDPGALVLPRRLVTTNRPERPLLSDFLGSLGAGAYDASGDQTCASRISAGGSRSRPVSRESNTEHDQNPRSDRPWLLQQRSVSPKSEAEAPGVIKPSLPASRRPRVSVYSPSHQTRYLDDCMRSLLAQTYQDWEWIVLLNQGARWRPPTEDPRLRVVIKDDLTGVGAAKRYACSLALGEFLVELDHDDELRSDALQLIVDAFDANPQVGFVFSDFAQINEDGSRDDSRFDQSNGWVYEEDTVDRRSVLRCRSLEASPHNVSYIWFAPNHVRAFRRAIYEMTGGYDATRDVLDDQDIMCRLYQLTEFHLIDECLYLQRMHRTNTQREIEINARIQKGDGCAVRPLHRAKRAGLGQSSWIEGALPRTGGRQASGVPGS